MWSLVRRHLVAKIAAVLVLTLIVGFGVPAVLNARLQVREMARMHEQAAESLARGLSAGVRTAMLSGNGITAREMVHDARSEVGDAVIRIYAPNGEEVFAPKAEAPPQDSWPPHVKAALTGLEPMPIDDSVTAFPVLNEERCRRCHEAGNARAVLTIGTVGATVPIDGKDPSLDALNHIIRSGFEQIMTAEKEDQLDDYFEELTKQAPLISAVAVLNSEGEHAFGAEGLAVDADRFAAAMRTKQPVTIAEDGSRVRIQPLPNEPQCHACHEEAEPMRGAVVIRVGDGNVDPQQNLWGVVDISLRHVMLSGLGRLIARFLDSVATTGAVTTLTLHDAEGRLYRDAFAEQDPPAMVGQILAQSQTEAQAAGDDHSFTYVTPLVNEEKCQQCHGTDYELRGAIEVVLDTSAAAAKRNELVTIGIVFGAGTIFLTLISLYLGIRLTVIRPVAEMGDVADRVGEGELESRVMVRSVDEIGRLGGRLNQMIVELRKKLELAKFVSKATAETVDGTEGAVSLGGTRKRMAVVFSDVRGFTSFSETREPEEVIQALNRYLDAQTKVVQKWGGDIDKFVGDELFARFAGDDMEARALSCGVEMIEAVEAVNRELGGDATRLAVGVGINVGDVVLGAIGAQQRMDFTVIGDVVNLGARLCSAAEGGQVLVSQPIREMVGDHDQVELEELEPIMVKGKKDPVPIFAAARTKKA